MRDSFNRNVIPSVDAPFLCMEGTFTQFPESVQDGTVDACLIAQAFHWAHPEYAEAAKTIGRSLKPHNGQLVFIWNSESLSVPWIKTFRDTYEVYDGHSPQQRFKLWHALYDTPEYKTLFDPPVFTVWNSKSPCTKEIAINRVMSKSYTSVLSKEESEALISKLEQVLDSAEDMVWIDKEKGVFEYNYETDVVIMNRK
uniref:S-adenosyl-L-methionine-dependent methyltransferase n=1 Tax=Phaffia rhodozyma TaxID=264483 RepID=A0A1I9Q748_PHARH|nr:S-adenosyl-L-methionine-dependent methyltransferase [Phaffia rhodozyma]